MGQVQVVFALHHVIREFVAHGKTKAIGFAVVADHVEAADFRFFTGVFSKRRHRESLAWAHHDAAVAFVEPLRLHTDLARRGLAALYAPFEDAQGVGHRTVVTGLLVHLVPRRGAAQVGQAGAADQQVSRVRVVERRQDFQVGQQCTVVVAVAQAQPVDLLRQLDARLDGRQRQLTHAAGRLYFAQLGAFYDADTALTVRNSN